MTTLESLGRRLQDIVARRGAVYVRRGAFDDYTSIGVSASTEIRVEPILAPPDEVGQRQQVAGRYTIDGLLLQTRDLAVIPALTSSRVHLGISSGPGEDELGRPLLEFEFFGVWMTTGAEIPLGITSGELPFSCTFEVPLALVGTSPINVS